MEHLGDVIFRQFTAMGDEEQEACAQCGKVWYRIHHRNGLCHQCQKVDQTKGERKMSRIFWTLFLFIVGGIFLSVVDVVSGVNLQQLGVAFVPRMFHDVSYMLMGAVCFWIPRRFGHRLQKA